MHSRDLPNLLSIGRILLVPPVVWALLQGHYALALGLYALAGLTDGLDGYLARHYGWQTPLGAMLDPMGDKLLQVSCYGVLGYQGLLPWWLVVLVLGRDVVIVLGALAYRWLIGPYAMAVTPLSKFNTAVQLMLPVVVLVDQSTVVQDHGLIAGLTYVVAFTTGASGVHYVLEWSVRAGRARKIGHER